VLDAAECPPTFGTDPGQVVALIAGGPEAVFRAREGAEDDPDDGARALASLGPAGTDVVVGIAASGVTPWVRGVLAAAREAGAATALVTAGNPEEIPADEVIRLETGAEAVAGSTRLKAGTATKIVLNLLSTGAMVRLGKVHGNRMVDLRAGSEKLRRRALRLTAELTGREEGAAADLLAKAGGEVKTAVVMDRFGAGPDDARERLRRAGGFLRAALAGEEES
jgi:N-acetylmuramic acid 6-phosphate etherase